MRKVDESTKVGIFAPPSRGQKSCLRKVDVSIEEKKVDESIKHIGLDAAIA